MNDILEKWGLSCMEAIPTSIHSQTTWNVGEKYILKRFRSTDDATRSIQFSQALAQEGISVATFIPAQDGSFTTDDGIYGLMVKFSGKHADLFAEPILAFEMGRELARLHIALVHIEAHTKCSNSDLLADWRSTFKPSFGSMFPGAMVTHMDELFSELYPKLPRQLIHRDVHPQNVLFSDGRLTGWLDFDISQRNARLFDIAYLLSGLLIGSLKDDTKIETWRVICHKLMEGYGTVSPLTKDESDALLPLMIMIEFLFVWFWGRQGNSEQREVAVELAKWIYDDYRRENNVQQCQTLQ